MNVLVIILVIAIVLVLLTLVFAYKLFMYGFRIGNRGRRTPHELMEGNGMYEKRIVDEMLNTADKMEKEPFEMHEIVSRDGLKLKGYSLFVDETAPIVLFVHGYTGTWKLDGYGTYRLCKERGYNLFVFDQRAHGASEGKDTTFGVMEQYDCLDWINYIKDKYGKDRPLLLSGVSMGCSTAIMAAALATNKLVDGLIADCGYSCGTDIFAKAAKDLNLPVSLAVKIAVLGSKIYGGFDASKATVSESSSKLDMPVLFIHGTIDSVVPFEMLEKNFNACGSKNKYKAVFENCNHAQAAAFDYEKWIEAVDVLLNDVRGFNTANN